MALAETGTSPTTSLTKAAQEDRLRAFSSGLFAAAMALVLYLVTIAPDLTWSHQSGDGGELITAAHTLGVPHPPGYPLYVLVGRLFSLLPVGSVAFRLNLMSAVGMAAAAGLLTAAIISWPGRRIRTTTAVAAALLFAVTPLVWSQAIVTEVYALNAAFVGALLLALSRGWSLVAGVSLGLAIVSHSTSVLLVPLAGLIVPRRAAALGGLLLGLSPLLLLPLFASGDSPVVWGDARTPAGWWWLVSGELYRRNLGHWPGAPHWDGLRRALTADLGVALVAGLALVVIGRVMRPSEKTRTAADRNLGRGLLLTVALYVVFVILYDTPDTSVLLIPALMCLAMLVAREIDGLGAAALVAPLLVVAFGFSQVSLRGEHTVRPLALDLLTALPERAVALTPGDVTIFTLWYFHHVEGARPDIIPVDANLFAFDWYRDRLAAQYPDLAGLDVDDLPAFEQLNAGARPFCAVGLTAPVSRPSAAVAAASTEAAAPYLDCTE